MQGRVWHTLSRFFGFADSVCHMTNQAWCCSAKPIYRPRLAILIAIAKLDCDLLIYFSMRFSNWYRQSRHSPTQCHSFLSLYCTSKPSHTQIDRLPDEGNSYTSPVSLLDDPYLDLCPCTTGRVRYCDIMHLLNYCASQCHMSQI